MRANLIELAYLVAAVLFIIGLKGMTRPRTAVRGNFLAGVGMLIAICAVLIDKQIVSYGGLAIGVAIGTAIGIAFATRVSMTSMPQMVAAFNGFGGLASALVAAGQYLVAAEVFAALPLAEHAPASVAIGLAALIGMVTFTGSLVALAKLQGVSLGPLEKLPASQSLNAVLLITALGFGVALVADPASYWLWACVGVSGLLGLALVLPIGGADMPVVISLLNSYSGLAAAAAGFALGNTALIISGSLVGASGLILTSVMCRGMNRSLSNVLFGGVGGTSSAGAGAGEEIYAGKIKKTSPDEVAMILEGASRVAIVPGYGMAVGQAQHAISDLMTILEENGTTVEFGIHPVAGRMPGHMNVLLAEADVPYDALKEMEVINPTFGQVDVVIVVGANDVVNPSARTDTTGPIAGMPILDVDKARMVVVIKRSLSPGFTGIANPLFAADNTLMLFGDAKDAVLGIVTELGESHAAAHRLAS